jgi:hypothetical protein
VHIFIFGIRSKNLSYNKGVRVIVSIRIITNFQEKIQQNIIARKVNSLKNKVEQEVLKVLTGLRNPLICKFKKPIVDKVMLIRYTIHEKSNYSKVEKLVPLVIYVFLTLRNFKVNKSDLVQVSEIYYKEFNCFFYQLKNYMVSYYQGDNYV